MQRPDISNGDYRHLVWHGYRGWCDASSPAADLLTSARDPAALVSHDRAGGRGKKRNVVARVAAGREVAWVKWFRPRSPLSWLRYLGRRTKAEKAWDAAFALLGAGVHTPRPLACLRRDGPRARLYAVMIFEDFADARHFADALEAAGERRADLLAAAGRFLARFHASGFRHRDLQGPNLLVRPDDHGFAFALVDINRSRVLVRPGLARRLRDLERLPLADDDLETFFHAYMNGDGSDAAARYRHRMRQRARLQRLPRPFNRIVRRLWYYWRELIP